MEMESTPVHIVVGAGTSAVLLVHELVIRYHHDVILVVDSDLKERDTSEKAWSYDAYDNIVANHFWSTTQYKLGGRSIALPVGKGIGGSSNVNAMIYTEPHSQTFKIWPSSSHWSESSINAHLSRVREIIQPNPYTSVEKYALSGILPDGNDQVQYNYHSTMANDFQSRNRFDRIIADCQATGRLTIMQNVQVTRVLFDSVNVAVGVEYVDVVDETIKHCIHTKLQGEVILCAGALQSPRILYDSISQINSDNKLSPYLASIGNNLQDHLIAPFILLGDWSKHVAADKNKHKSMPINGIHAIVYLDDAGEIWTDDANTTTPPSAQLLIVDGSIALGLSDMLIPQFSNNTFYSTYIRPWLIAIMKFVGGLSLIQYIVSRYVFGVLVGLVQPRAKGRLQVIPNNDSGGVSSIRVDPNYLSDESDLHVMYNAIQRARSLADKGRRESLYSLELLPGPIFNYVSTIQSFRSYLHCFATTYFHLTSTCSMNSIVDTEFKVDTSLIDGDVKGTNDVSKLRIVDASVIPTIPTNNPAATCMMLGVAAASLIAKDFENVPTRF